MQWGSRGDWTTLADRLLAGAHRHLTPDGTGVALSGEQSSHGKAADLMEGFTRTFLLHCFLVSQRGSGVGGSVYVEGLERVFAGPATAHPWPAPEPNGFATVEAAGVALGLFAAPEHTWHRLSSAAQGGLAMWLEAAALAPAHDNNWMLFRPTIAAFLRSVGREGGLASDPVGPDAWRCLDDWPQGQGCISDGPERAFDYYNSFALHYYPALVSWLAGDSEALASSTERLHDHLKTLPAFFDSGGAPILFGRSLTYRLALVAAVSVGAVTEALPFSYGEARELLASVAESFVNHGLFAEDDAVPVGWWGASSVVRQDYSGPASSYWLAKTFAHLLLPEEHGFWQEPIVPVERAPVVVLRTPGLLVSTDAASHGVARLFNHGSSGRTTMVVRQVHDDPWYARLTYSSRSEPVDTVAARSGALSFVEGDAHSSRGPIRTVGWGDTWMSSASVHRYPVGTPLEVSQVRSTKRMIEIRKPEVHQLTYIYGEWAIEIAVVPPGEQLRGPAVWGGSAIPAFGLRDLPLDSEGVIAITVGEQLCSVAAALHGFESAGVAEQTMPGALGASTAFPFLRTADVASPLSRRWFAIASVVGPVDVLKPGFLNDAPRVEDFSASTITIRRPRRPAVVVRWRGGLFVDENPGTVPTMR